MKNNIIADIRKKQDEIIVMVNTTFDAIINEVSVLSHLDNKEISDYELTYPLTNASGFKGKKVIAVILNGKRIITPTWKLVVKTILSDAIKDKVIRKNIFELRDKLLGRKRTRLSSSSEGMRSALKLDDNLYVETHYDTETLMNLLLQILNEISYDYSSVKVAIKN